jgi:hypothetical protein
MADEKTPEQLQQEMFDSATMAPAEPEPAPSEPPLAVEPSPAAEQQPPPTVTPPPEPAEGHVPPWRLREEAEGRRLAEDRARQLEARLNEVAAHLQQQQKKPDFFENPDQATQALVHQVLQPYAESRNKVDMYNSQMIAKYVHGADKVEAAEQAFLQARDAQSLDPADYERVVQSPNRWDAVVQWHKRQSIVSTVGDDPEAWYKKRLEADLADPKFQAEMLEKVRGSAAKRPPETRLPPSLSRSTAVASAAGDGVGDMSDQSLFRYAMGKPQ